MINKFAKFIVFFLVFLLLVCLPFFLNDMHTIYLKHKLHSSIVEHAKRPKYRPDFIESIEILEKLKKKRYSDHAVSVLITCLESGEPAQQWTAMHLLLMVDKSYAKAAIPALQKLADEKRALGRIPNSAEATLLDLQD